jgi:hypothetical protein
MAKPIWLKVACPIGVLGVSCRGTTSCWRFFVVITIVHQEKRYDINGQLFAKGKSPQAETTSWLRLVS